MRKLTLLLFLTAGLAGLLQAQKYTISGYVREKGSRELLIGVNIYIPGTQTGTVTNNYGFYSLTLPQGKYNLRYSYVGYNTISKEIELDKDIVSTIDLEPVITLKGVTIVAEGAERVSEEPQMSVVSVPIHQVGEIPAFLGEKDVFKVLQLMPGVQKGTEGSSGLYVRGGGPDQNLIILDDATVYNANHLFGFFSVFNGDALKSVELTKGGFPARYGGRLSSVVEMNMKDGNKEKLSGNGGIGVISSRLTLEGPIVPGKSSFLISGRRTYLDILIQPFLAMQQTSAGYYFYDFNAKLNYDFGDKNKLYLSGYFGRDKFYIADKSGGNASRYEAGMFWENGTGTLRWNHLFSNKLFANTSLIYSNYMLKTYIQDYYDVNSFFYLDYHSGIRDLSGKFDLSYNPSPNHYIRMGVQVINHTFTPGALVLKDSYLGSDTLITKIYNSYENGIYIEDEIKAGSRVKLNAGFRLSHFVNVKKHYFNPEPRFSGSYLIKPGLSAKVSYARMNQYVHLLSPTGIGLPTDLWVPATDQIAPQRSSQVAAGLAKDLTEPGITVTLEGYYKRSHNIIGYKEGASFLLIEDPQATESFTWQDNITSGQAWSYGAEFLIQKKTGKLSGWIGYTLSWTQFQFDELNFGEKFYARYDRRHDISVVGIYKPSDRITISATWVYGTGNAITMPLGEYWTAPHNIDIWGDEPPYIWSDYVEDYGEKNGFRMAPYHRLDLGMQLHQPHDNWEGTWEFSIYNAYSRKNPFFYYIDTETINLKNIRVLKQVSLFPIIPSVSYSFKF
jgi:hypothetical protein